MNNSTALKEDASSKLEHFDNVDVVLGIPSYNNEGTIRSVAETIANGFVDKFPRKEALLMLSDGDSEDRTRQEVKNANLPERIDRLVTCYEGRSGKGSAFRAIFQASNILDAEAALLVDADLRKFPPNWVESHLRPILEDNMDLMAPLYIRHKYDATITNNVCFPVVTGVFGQNIRQPIGGDFTVSREMMDHYLDQDVWSSDVARFGIDIWMTTTALGDGFQVGETNLGAKIHDPKDPGESLGPMFRQVVGTLFRQMKRYQYYWNSVTEISETRKFGPKVDDQPKPVSVNRDQLESKAIDGWNEFGQTYSRILPDSTDETVESIFATTDENGSLGLMKPSDWARVVYDFCVAYNFIDIENSRLMDMMVPLYFARCVALFREMDPLLDDEAELYLRQLTKDFWNERDYLVNRWRDESA